MPALADEFRSFVGFVDRKTFIADAKHFEPFVDLSVPAVNNEASKPFFRLAIFLSPFTLNLYTKYTIDFGGRKLFLAANLLCELIPVNHGFAEPDYFAEVRSPPIFFQVLIPNIVCHLLVPGLLLPRPNYTKYTI